MTENINYAVLIRKLRGASISSKEEIALEGDEWEPGGILDEWEPEGILDESEPEGILDESELERILDKLKLLIAQKDEIGLKVLESDVYGREDDKEAMELVRSRKWLYHKAMKKASKPDVHGGEDAKKADLNAHPDLLSILGDIGKTYFGEYLNANPDLQIIGEEIFNKCKGHPIAAKSVVALLCSIPSHDEWTKILMNHIWDLKLQENASKYVLPALWLSYRYLSPQLKRCFAYCSIFPKDYEFTKKEVILLWMAERFLQPKGGTRMEDVGE